LSPAFPDAWLDKLLEQSRDFAKAAEIMGRNTLGLALIAGARIRSLTTDADSLDLTRIEFSIGQDPSVREASLSEFREAIADLLLTPLQIRELPDRPDVEALQAHVGGRYMLEASLFQVRLLELRHNLGLSEITLRFNELQHVLALEDLRDALDERVRSELGPGREQDAVAIDLSVVDKAQEANASGNWAATVAMLNPWLTPISMLVRTGEAKELGADIHGRLSVGLDLLGTAYANLGDLDAANEVLRLGVQWAGESDKAGDLFLALGRALVASEKHGEAIGLLRRALRLGVEERQALPLLVRSLAARDQSLASMVCATRARDVGADLAALESSLVELKARLGDAWLRFEAWIGDAE
jgi:tetratricopeptide (TPR) repeat protein